MWRPCLVWVASQHCRTWAQCVNHENSAPHSNILFQSSQALLRYDGIISQYQTTPVAEDISGFVRDGLREMEGSSDSHVNEEDEDGKEHGMNVSFIELQSGGDYGDKASFIELKHEKRHEPHHHHGHHYHRRSFVHGRRDNPVHHENLPTTIATTIALMLVGMMAVGICIFYLVNYPDEDIQAVTWTVLSSTISLFCAVLIFSSLRCMMEILLGEKVGVHSQHQKPDTKLVVSNFVHFIIIFILMQALVLIHRQKNFPMKALAKIGGHITAFAAIEAFGTLMHHSFSGSWCVGLLLVGLAFFTMWGLSTLAHFVRSGLGPKSEEQKITFGEECDAAGREYVSLTVGLLVSMLIRQMITGRLPPIHGSPRNKTMSEIWQLCAWATMLISALLILTYVARDALKESSKGTNRGNWARLGQATLSMSAGWCLLSWGQWLFWRGVGEKLGEADKMEARMIMAIAFSALVFSCIFIFDFIADYIVTQARPRALISTMALLLGLAWEAVFTLAIESISGNYIKHPAEYIYCELGLTFCLCGVVLPAWVMYLIPRAEEGDFLEEEQR